MPLPALERYEFGPYRMDSRERLLHRGEELVPLPPKAVATLLVLVQSAGRMVDKNDIMSAVWADTFVEDGVLARNISLLRRTLGDTAEAPVYIETIPKRGYRFIAPVRNAAAEIAAASLDDYNGKGTELAIPEPPPRPRIAITRAAAVAGAAVLLVTAAALAYLGRTHATTAAPPPTGGQTTLAVVPFRSIENGSSHDYFADGMTQALISSLASLRKVRVISMVSEPGRRTDTAWAAILRDRTVRRVLTGSVQRSGGRVRIDAQLIEPATRAVHWAHSYERDVQNVLSLQSEVAEAIADEIQLTVTAEDRERLHHQSPAKAEALDAYLQGRYFWNRRTEDGLRRAIKHFQRAIDADPGYALAYSALADSWSILASIGTDGVAPNEAMPLAKAAAQKALDLDPELSDAHVSLAYILLSYDWDLEGAAQEFARALTLNPNSATGRHWYSHYFMAAGDLQQASEQMRQALELEPLSPSINIGVGWCLYYSRKYDEAIERFRAVTEMDPSVPLAHQTLGMAYQQKGDLDLAIEEYKRAAAFSNNSPASVASLASAYAGAGRPAEARLELARLHEMSRSRYVPAFYFATVYYASGDLANTFEYGWKAVAERCDYLMYLRVEPRAGKLGAHPEFLRAMAAVQKR